MLRSILVLIFAALAAAGCGGDGAHGGRSVVAGLYPLAFAAQQIGGATVDVTNLTPAGAEPHGVELSARDVERARSADVVLYLGEGFQPALERAVRNADGETIDLLAGLEAIAREDGDAERPTRDPHVWLDPLRFARIARRIGHALDRPREADAFADRLHGLDRELEEGLAECARREIVTSHAAFGYLADRYRLEQVAITGLSPEAEPTPRELEAVIDAVRERRATTIFFETLVSPRLAETVAREAGVETAVLNPLEGLTPEQAERGEDYFSIMRDNLAALRAALGCR